MTLPLVMLGAIAVLAGLWIAASAFTTVTPSLTRTVAHLHRPPTRTVSTSAGTRLVRLFGARLDGDVVGRKLDLIGRTPQTHATYLATAGFAGFLLPVLIAAVVATVSTTVVAVTVGMACGTAAAGVLLVVADVEQRTKTASQDLRHQLSAYLDVLTMLLASNQGNEGALRLAAEAGDGRLFIELRRRMLEAATAGRPAVTALATLGHDLGLVELTEIAASASLATSQGAPVARSLTAKTESLRAALQAEQEADARVRTGKITFPLVAMGLVFIVLGLYPALVTIRNT
jgi:tight adherence protein C